MADMMDEDYEDEGQPSPEQARLSQSYLESTMKRKLEAEAQMQKLMRALDSRRNMLFDPVGLRVAGALLAPTKTGGAGESLGYAATAAADEMQKQALQNAEFAKMEFELGQKRLQQQEASDAMRMVMEMENPQLAAALPQPVAAPAPAVPAPAAEAPATEPDKMGEIIAARSPDMAQPAAAQPEAPVSPLAGSRMEELQRLAREQGAFQPAEAAPPAAPVTTAAPRRRVEMVTPSGALGYAMRTGAPDLYKYFQEQENLGLRRKEVDYKGIRAVTVDGVTVPLSVPEQRRLTKLQQNDDFEGLNKFYLRKFGIPPVYVKDEKSGEWRAKTTAEKEEAKALAGGIEAKVYPTRFGPISMLPADYFRFRKIDEADPKAGEDFLRRIVAGEATSPAGEKPKLITEDERKYQESRKTEIMKEDVKASAEQAALVQKRATDASEMREIVDNLDSTAKTNPKVFGLLQGPGLVKSIARAVDQSNSTVKIENISQYKLKGNDLLALQDAANNVARLQNMIRKAARIPGEGQTSDLETRMQIAMSLTTSMSPEIIRLRAEVMRERANFDEKVFELWSKYKKSEKGFYQEFLTESKEYKDLKKNYENKLKTIRDANAEFFANPSGAVAPRTSAPSGASTPSGGALQRWNR
jgi:hypothetical protein